MKKTFLFLVVGIILSGCGGGVVKVNNEINLGDHLKDNAPSFMLNDVAEVISVIEVGNSDSLVLKRVFPEDEHDGMLLINGGDVLLSVDMMSGTIRSVIGHKGKGPGEYLRLSGAAYGKDGSVYVCDMNPKRILKYHSDGSFAGNIQFDNAASISVLPDGKLAVSLSPVGNEKTRLKIYDELTGQVRNSELRDRDVNTAMVYLNSLWGNDDYSYFKMPFSDTIYRVTSHEESPWLVLSSGNYTVPIDAYSSLDKLKSVSRECISSISKVFNSKYMYLKYWLSDMMYLDMWSIEGCNLIGRNLLKHPGPGSHAGFDVDVNGKRTLAVPCYMSEKYLVCEFVNVEDAKKIYPAVTEQSNPILLIMKFV